MDRTLDAVRRVRQMERCFDAVCAAPVGNRDAEQMLQQLKDYYQGGQWLEDYERDERGEFPAELKRGVLSQDGLYDLLCRWEEAKP